MWLLIHVTVPDEEQGRALADHLVSHHLAACVNIVPGIQSVYRWQGKLNCDAECLLLIKSHSDQWTELEQAVKARHSYEVPEIIAVPIERGEPAYMQWLTASLKETNEAEG